jgi:sugar phosphate isomerase/epimerase
LADAETADARPNLVNTAHNLMPGNDRSAMQREIAFHDVNVRSADRANADIHAHLAVGGTRWRDLLQSMEQAIAVAEQNGILLGVEPETGNVVSSARKARQLLDELHSSRVKIVIDPANLFHAGQIERVRETMEEAFQLLGTDIVMAHAKELAANGAVGNLAPGRGLVDWSYYFGVLSRMDFHGAMILHGLSEADMPQAVRFLRSKLCD